MTDSLHNLVRNRTAGFPGAQQDGYQREAVDAFVAELLQRLEEAPPGGDSSASSMSRRHIERMSEKMAELLDTAEENAAELIADAERESSAIVERGRREAAGVTARADADAKAATLKTEQQLAEARSKVETEVEQQRQASEREAREAFAAAKRQTEQLLEGAQAHKRELESAVDLLENRRRAVVVGLNQVARRLDATVEQVEQLGDVRATDNQTGTDRS